MIISNSKNFAVSRAQKTGGTSLEMYILESGIIDFDSDTYTLEGGFSDWKEFKAYSDANNNLKYSELPQKLYGYNYLKDAQKTYSEIVAEGLAPADMPWIGTIRHPLEWLASLYYYANVRRKIVSSENLKNHGKYMPQDIFNAANMTEPDASWDLVFVIMPENQNVKDSLKAQTAYYPDHADLFNIENIHEHASAFIKSNGGTVNGRIEARKSENDPAYYLNNLSEDRKQKTLEKYEKDLIAWENAYSAFN